MSIHAAYHVMLVAVSDLLGDLVALPSHHGGHQLRAQKVQGRLDRYLLHSCGLLFALQLVRLLRSIFGFHLSVGKRVTPVRRSVDECALFDMHCRPTRMCVCVCGAS